MFNLDVGFGRPAFLALLLLLPLLWVFSYRSLAGLGNVRRLLAIALRSLVVLLFVLALAEVQLRKISQKMTVIYLLDQSESIPLAKRQLMLEYVSEAVSKHRRDERQDRAGVIVFGRDATIEIPPFDDDVPRLSRPESYLENTEATNLEAAMKLALASFPDDSAKRIVLVTDGNENQGNARAVAQMLAENQIGIDVVPVRLTTRSEVAVEKIAIPSDVRRGQPTEARVVLNNFAEGTGSAEGRSVRGKLKITQQVGADEQLISEMPVDLPPGKTVLRFEHTIDQPAVYRYRAVFTPDDPADDLMAQNNSATAFTYVRGKGRVLMIVDWEEPGEFDFLIERLRSNNIEIDVMPSDQLFTNLAELQGYDSVVLANVPRSSGDSKAVTNFSDEQIQMLVSNTEQMGCGLVMLGGPNSFGAGGWANTELEKAMPVDFQIKNSKIQAVGALVLMMHASEMAQGNHWQKVVAREAIEVLGPMDYCGLLHWDNFGGDAWLWGKPNGLIRVSGQKNQMMARLDRMTPGDMPQFDPAMRMALAGFNRVNAAVKHMIIISDGDPSPPRAATITGYVNAKIKISTVAVGTHGPPGSTPLQNIAQQTGGRYYVVTNPKALPKIYQKEARRVARPLVKDFTPPISPVLDYRHEILDGIEGPLPPIKGMVLTTVKENPLVEVSLISPQPPDRENATVLASWTYKLGRTAVLTTDAGKRWADSWTEWENYDKFFTQLIRWSMRPVNEENKFAVSSDVQDGRVRIVVTAMDKDDEFLNFLTIGGAAVGPDLGEPLDLTFSQVAPGRYVAEFDAASSGPYLFSINPGEEHGTIRAGVNVPYSAEYQDKETNLALLEFLAELKPEGGEPGALIGRDLAEDTLESLLGVDSFRLDLAKAVSSQDVWPLFMVIGMCVFFADVFIRRVTISYEWIEPLVVWFREKVLRRGRQEQADQRLDRLRSRKAAVQQQLDERRATARFEPVVDADAPAEPQRPLDDVLRDASGGSSATAPRRTATSQPMTPGQGEADDYTARLLAAKRKVQEERQRRPPDQK
ncbi:MAG: VWA domain-containing protein [Pirellulaceae bacterium]|nr:VWA domain-containing protein [Pirellulaceae bacterium]